MAFAFAGQWGPEPVVDRYGNAIYSATFRVLTTTGAEATVYTDRTKATTVAQPLDVDGEANATFYAAPGRYTVELTAGGSVTSFPVGVVPDAEDVLDPATADVAYEHQARNPVNARRFCAADATIDANGVFTQGTDTGTELSSAAAEARTAGRPLYLPDGVYYSTVALTRQDAEWIVGDGSGSTVIVFSLDALTDGLTWSRAGTTGYGMRGGLRGVTLRGVNDRLNVRDVLHLNTMGYFTLDDVELRGGARYGLGVTDVIAISGRLVHCHRNKTAGLWTGGGTPTTTWFEHSYFNETREGLGADIDCLGASFESCVFESNGRDVPGTGLGGVRIREGYVTFKGACFWENNVGHDIWAGTVATTHVALGAFHGLLGPDSDTSYAHVRLDQYVTSAAISPGKYDVRNGGSFLIHPLARGVVGAVGKGTTTPVTMTDATDPNVSPFGMLVAVDAVSGDTRTYGRFDPRFRDAHVSRFLRLADGTLALPGMAYTSDPDTGWMRMGENRQIAACGGGAVLDLTPDHVRTSVPLRIRTYTTAGRPAASIGAGLNVFDTDLTKPIWSDGTNWRDATGTVV